MDQRVWLRVKKQVLFAVALLGLCSGCATHALWLNGVPPVLEIYQMVEVKIYRLGMECRLEVITKTDTVITLPTRCLTVPHVSKTAPPVPKEPQ